MEWIKRWCRSGLVRGLVAGVVGWIAMAGVTHLWNDHALLHTLVQIEMLRQQGQGGGGGTPATSPPASVVTPSSLPPTSPRLPGAP